MGVYQNPPTANGSTPAGFLGYRSGKIYDPWQGFDTAALSSGPSATITYYMPFTVKEDVSISELGFLVSTLGGNATLAIFSTNGSLLDRPGGATPRAKSASVDCTATGTKTSTLKDSGGSPLASLQLLRADLHWVGAQFDSTAIRFQTLPSSAALLTSLVGVDAFSDLSTTSGVAASEWIVNGSTYGIWPDLTSATLARDNGHKVPAFRFKVA